MNDLYEYVLENLEISVKKIGKGSVIANVKITIAGLITIKGYTYRKSHYLNEHLGKNVYIDPPKIPLSKGGKAIIAVFFEYEDLWYAVMKKIDEKVSEVINN
jgi:hypothetical protein